MKSSHPELAQLTLQPAELDLKSPRTQLMLGLGLAVLSCVVADYPFIWNTDFLLHVSLTVLVGLIAFELTGLYGNRLGAIPAVWSAFLLSCYPAGSGTGASIHSLQGLQDLFALFMLLSFFSYQRFRLLKEKSYAVAAGVFFVLCFITGGLSAIVLPILIWPYELLFTNSPVFLYRAEEQEPNIESPIVTSVRLLFFGTIWLVMSLIFELGISALNPKGMRFGLAQIVVVFCIFVPLLMLPISWAQNRKQVQIVAAVSMVLLTVAAWGFHNLRGEQYLF